MEGFIVIFPDAGGSFNPSGFINWTTKDLKMVRFYIIEFITSIESKQKGNDLSRHMYW